MDWRMMSANTASRLHACAEAVDGTTVSSRTARMRTRFMALKVQRAQADEEGMKNILISTTLASASMLVVIADAFARASWG
jgi:hypothetical protein